MKGDDSWWIWMKVNVNRIKLIKVGESDEKRNVEVEEFVLKWV